MRARQNPFRVDRLQQIRYRFEHASLQQLIERLEQLSLRGAIIGPHGAGKSTLLRDLNRELQSQGHVSVMARLNSEVRSRAVPFVDHLLQTIPSGAILLLDGAEQLDRRSWKRLQRAPQPAGLIITTHRAGWLPTVYECVPRPQVLQELVKRLQGETTVLTTRELEKLYTRHRGNLRECLRDLYDQWADGSLENR